MIQINQLLWLSIPEYRLSSGTVTNEPHRRQGFTKAFSGGFSFVLLLFINSKENFSLKLFISKSYNIEAKMILNVGAKHLYMVLCFTTLKPTKISSYEKLLLKSLIW